MNTVYIQSGTFPFELNFGSLLSPISDEEFMDFCRRNPEMKIEQTKEGDIIVMPPTGRETGHRNASLTTLLGNWTQADGTGVDFDSSTLFILLNGAKRGTDAAWIRRERWELLTEDERAGFPPLCPDFVIELRSPTDSLKSLQEKMEEYIENGAQLGWLIDPFERRVYVYCPQSTVEILAEPQLLSSEPLLRGFTLSLSRFW